MKTNFNYIPLENFIDISLVKKTFKKSNQKLYSPERFLLLNLKFNGQYSREEIILAPLKNIKYILKVIIR